MNTVSTSQQSPQQQHRHCVYSISGTRGETSQAEITLLVSLQYLLRHYEDVTLQRLACRSLLHKYSHLWQFTATNNVSTWLRNKVYVRPPLFPTTHLLNIVFPHQQPKLSHDSHFRQLCTFSPLMWSRMENRAHISSHLKSIRIFPNSVSVSLGNPLWIQFLFNSKPKTTRTKKEKWNKAVTLDVPQGKFLKPNKYFKMAFCAYILVQYTCILQIIIYINYQM